jgi:hypothetical protein
MVKKFLMPIFFLLLFAIAAAAQNRKLPAGTDAVTKPRMPGAPVTKSDSDQDLNFPPDMRARMAIERADIEYRKSHEDADKLNDMSAEVAKSYRDRGNLTAEELKKLSAIEKLAKRILDHVGGDEVDDKNKDSQRSVSQAVEQMSEAAANVQKGMKEQTRYGVSATVIANSNQIISLAQFIRHTVRAD